MAWDVLSGITKMAWDVLSGVSKLHGMFCSRWQIDVGCFIMGVKKGHRMFCPGMFCHTFHYFEYHVLLCVEDEFGFLVHLVVLS